ncbi:uncharacterized protein [Cicer arietinum]|uniref:Uncharacterized protein LOC101501928 isoform X2 n=1 Tax=Cicer arietinum TaxID=3827 RepID=A0A1S2YDR0_CICAR|nr:uncharacterized protein LOC101501928 isoform X2 [Cicer arietinum]
MQITRWRNFLSMKNHIIPSVSHFSAFHSTPCSCHKWKSNPDIGGQKPSKNQIKFVTRQKRADAKKALKHLLYNSGSSKFSFEDKETKRKHDGNSGDRSNSYSNNGQPKSGQRFGGKPQKKTTRKIRRESFCEDVDGHPEQIFQATFGNRWYTWSFSNMRGSSSEQSTYGFEWRENASRTNKWKTASDDENDDNDKDDNSCCVGSSSDRTILGLPPTGPLKIEDVKNAFRLSALKWHPDKHQGPSQAIAEEKFKLCLNAYKTLCSALSPA